jgi:hypothetical protein
LDHESVRVSLEKLHEGAGEGGDVCELQDNVGMKDAELVAHAVETADQIQGRSGQRRKRRRR